jgi:hypothetical protein
MDDDTRNAERKWRQTGASTDGEAYIQAVIRSTDAPILPMVTALIRNTRAMQALTALALPTGEVTLDAAMRQLTNAQRRAWLNGPTLMLEAMQKPVTPDDVVAFLRNDGSLDRYADFGYGLMDNYPTMLGGPYAENALPVRRDLAAEAAVDAAIERSRGRTDALAGHGPAIFDGPYMTGYRYGRVEIGHPMEHRSATE